MTNHRMNERAWALAEAYMAPETLGDFRMVATAANRQPAAAAYLRLYGESSYRLVGMSVLRIEGGEIVAIDSFTPELITAFGLPATL